MAAGGEEQGEREQRQQQQQQQQPAVEQQAGDGSMWRQSSRGAPLRARSGRGARASELHPKERAGPVSQLFMLYLNPIIALGARRQLDPSDLPAPPRVLKAAVASARIERCWADEQRARGEQASLWRALWRALRARWAMSCFAMSLYVFGTITAPLCLQALMKSITEPDAYAQQPFLGVTSQWGIVGLLVACLLVGSLSGNIGMSMGIGIGVEARAGVIMAVFNKSLRLAPTVRRNNGQITNLMSNDSERIFQALLISQMLWMSPIVVLGCVALLMAEPAVGPLAGAMGGICILLLLPLLLQLGRSQSSAKRLMLVNTDARLSATGEALGGIQMIKMNAWEEQIAARIQEQRVAEMKHARYSLLLAVHNNTLLFAMPSVLLLVVLFVVALQSAQQITQVIVYTVLAYTSIIRFPLQTLPRAISALSQADVAVHRIQRFLLLHENQVLEEVAHGPVVRIDRASFTWDDAAASHAERQQASQQEASQQPAKREAEVAVSVERATDKAASGPVLHGIDLTVRSGELVAVVGKVASGKSSLLAAVLMEIGKLSGSVRVNLAPPPPVGTELGAGAGTAGEIGAPEALGRALDRALVHGGEAGSEALAVPGPSSFTFGVAGTKSSSGAAKMSSSDEIKNSTSKGIAYVAQEPWIQNATVRENILFQSAEGVSSLTEYGRSAQAVEHADPVDEDLFLACVRAAELEADVKILPQGLETEIGDRGINLSGGQRARVAIARALYRTLSQNLPLVLLDDCFSALDAEVGLKVFHTMVLDMMQGRTRVVVLNSHMHLLGQFDRVIALEDGRIVLDEPAAVALESPVLARIVALSQEDHDGGSRALSARTSPKSTPKSTPKARSTSDSARNGTSTSASTSTGTSIGTGTGTGTVASKPAMSREDTRLYKSEERKKGKVKMSTYRVWLRLSYQRHWVRVAVGTSLVLLFSGAQAAKVLSEYWLGVWTSTSYGDAVGLGVFAAGVVLMTALVQARGNLFIDLSTRSSLNLHGTLISNLLWAPVNAFFDVTPAGRILNRLSSDLDKVDSQLPQQALQFWSNVFQITSTLLLCAIASPYFLAVLLPVSGLFFYFGQYFSRSSQELKRIDSVSRSPLFSNFGETLAGATTVRAFGLQAALRRKMGALVDANTAAFYLFWLSARWLALRLDLLIVALQFSLCVLAVALQHSLDANLISLALVYSLSLTGMLQFTVRLQVEVSNYMTSVERLDSLSREIPQEAPAELPSDKDLPKPLGPGALEFRNVVLRYRPELPLVLKGVSFRVPAGSKVGVVGRTGAGKSSVLAALFRMVHPGTEQGEILIDGVDIQRVGLLALRRQLGIIPQSPFLFSGTLRFNLDPWGKHSDEAICAALRRVELHALAAGPEGLDKKLEERGSNLSVGERQLVQIARTFLQGANLVLCDEATANVDAASDQLVQRAIREQFKDKTVLTIAHRLQTLEHSDLIVVLSYGKLEQFGSPQALRAQPGLFQDMLHDANLLQPVQGQSA
jgi:ATP-binding cassette subfamily C (CFTR/MRP) protein 1